MPIATTTHRESMAQAYGDVSPFVSLHTADPGTTGTNEVTGGSPAYARKAITWNDGGSDGLITSNPIDLDVPAGTTITHIGIWSAATGGTFLDKATVTSAAFIAQGVYRLTLTYTQS